MSTSISSPHSNASERTVKSTNLVGVAVAQLGGNEAGGRGTTMSVVSPVLWVGGNGASPGESTPLTSMEAEGDVLIVEGHSRRISLGPGWVPGQPFWGAQN